MTRNALSATEGFAAFAFSAAQQMGSVLADATEAAASAAVRLAGFGRFLAKESQAGFIGFFDLGSHQHVQLHYPAHVCKLIL
eukprot:g32915.t1